MYQDFYALVEPGAAECGRMSDGQRDQVVDTIGGERGGRPCGGGSPVVADDVRLGDAEMIEHRDGVHGEQHDRIGVDAGRFGARPVPTLVVGDHLESGVDERTDLLAPQPFRVREPVDQQDRWPAVGRLAMHLDVDRDAPRIDVHACGP